MKYLINSVLLSFLMIALSAQDNPDSIQIRNSGKKIFFQQNSQDLSVREFSRIIRSNPEAYTEFMLGRVAFPYKIPRTAGGILVAPCLFFLRYPFMHNNDFPNKLDLYILGAGVAGGVLLVVSLPLELGYKRCAEKAAKIYNNGLHTSTIVKPKISFGLTSDGIGTWINF